LHVNGVNPICERRRKLKFLRGGIESAIARAGILPRAPVNAILDRGDGVYGNLRRAGLRIRSGRDVGLILRRAGDSDRCDGASWNCVEH
jgi:hypothetical protein